MQNWLGASRSLPNLQSSPEHTSSFRKPTELVFAIPQFGSLPEARLQKKKKKPSLSHVILHFYDMKAGDGGRGPAIAIAALPNLPAHDKPNGNEFLALAWRRISFMTL